MGGDGIVIVDTNSHHADASLILDPITIQAVMPYDCSTVSFEPMLWSLASFTAPTVLPNQHLLASDADDENAWTKSLSTLHTYQTPS